MKDDFEAFYAELDRRYGLSLVPRVRIGTVTAVASPTSCSLTLPGETTPRSGVPIVTPVVPAVGQLVRVELVADHPAVVDVLGGSLSGDTLVEFKPAGSTDTGSSASFATWINLGTVTVPAGFTAARYAVTISGVYAITASPTGLGLRLTVGGVAAVNETTTTAIDITNQPRADRTWQGRVTGLSAGAQSVVVQSKKGVGTGALRADTSSLITVSFGWES